MKNKLLFSLLPITISLLGLSPKIIIPGTNTIKTTFLPIGPFHIGDPDYTLMGYATPQKYYSQLREQLLTYIIGEDVPVTVSKTAYHEALKNEEIMLTFNIPINTRLTSAGLKCVLQFVDGDGNIVHSLTWNIKAITPETINAKDYTKNYFIKTNAVVDPDNSSNKYPEKIMFNKFIDYFNVNSYHRLSLSDFILSYSCDLPTASGTAYLKFTDYNHVFKDLDDDQEVPQFSIPISMTYKRNTGVLFSFPSKMYVNPASLDMSLVVKPGYKETRYFYLPINRRGDLLDQKFTLEVNNFGLNETSFSWDIYYTNNRDLIGDCSNSDYCVVGEVN